MRINILNKALLLLMTVIVLGVPVRSVSASDTVPRFEPSTCPFGSVSNLEIDCGYAVVPENHAQPDGVTIRLAIAILRSPNPAKVPDPVFILAGGPGGAFVRTAPLLPQSGLAAILTERDIVIVDQRGMGLSEPKIECPIYDSVLDMFDADFPSPKVAERLKQCRTDLIARGINMDVFNSEQNAADFDSIRKALGYEQVNLYGVSYGTLLGLLALRDHPQGIRSVILVSTLPPNVNPLEDGVTPFQNAFIRLVVNCNADPVCHAAYPDIRGRYQQVWEKLKTNPMQIAAGGMSFRFDERQLEETVLRGLSGPDGPKTLPGQISEFAEGRFESLKPFFEQVAATPPDQVPNLPLYAAMTCGLYGAHTNAARIMAAQARYSDIFKEASLTVGLRGYRVCEAWGMDLAAAESNAPAVSDVPVLLLTGEYDTAAPEWTALAAQTLSRSVVVQFPGVGHAFGADVCAQQIALGFLRNPSAKPDTTCVGSIPPTNFAIALSVTRPIVQGTAILLGVAALGGLARLALAFARGHRQIAWRVSLHHAGWPPMVAALVGIGVISLAPRLPGAVGSLSPVQLVIPLALAIQAAYIFSPDDEPALEMLLAAPRPVSWLVMERLAVAFLIQGVTALVGTGLVKILHPESSVALLLLSWIPSALFLSGLALFVTLRTRVMAFGAVIVGFLWAVFLLFSAAFMPGQAFPFPFNVIQPFLWAFNINVNTVEFTPSDFLLNRLFLAVAGICLIMSALHSVRDSEQILLDASRRRRRKGKLAAFPDPTALRPNRATVQPVPTIHTLSTSIYQLSGITRYEFNIHWRRRTFKIVTGVMILGGSILSLMVGSSLNRFVPGLPPLDSLPADQAQTLRGIALAAVSLSSLLWTLSFVLPVLAVDTVPMDVPVRETLDALPLSSFVYLAGKVAGVWLAGLSSIILSTAVLCALWWWRVGSFEPSPMVDLLLCGALPLLLLNSTFSVLLGATQPNRRRALLLLVFAFAVPAVIAGLVPGLNVIVPGNFFLMQHFMIGGIQTMLVVPPVVPPMAIIDPLVQRTILAGTAQLLAVGAAAFFIVQRRTKGSQRD